MLHTYRFSDFLVPAKIFVDPVMFLLKFKYLHMRMYNNGELNPFTGCVCSDLAPADPGVPAPSYWPVWG